MVWVVGDVVSQARRLLQDTGTPYRYTDDELVSAYNSAMAEVRRLRSDLLLPDLNDYQQAVRLGVDLAEPLAVEDSFFPALVDYVVGYTSMQEDEFAVDGRAMALMARFSSRLVGKGV